MKEAAIDPVEEKFFNLTVSADAVIRLFTGAETSNVHLINAADGGRYYVFGGLPTPYRSGIELTLSRTKQGMSFVGDDERREELTFTNPQLAVECAKIPRETNVILDGVLLASLQRIHVLADRTIVNEQWQSINPNGLLATFNAVNELLLRGYGYSEGQIGKIQQNLGPRFLLADTDGKFGGSFAVQPDLFYFDTLQAIRPKSKFSDVRYENGL